MAMLYHPALGQTVQFQVDEVPAGGDSQTAAVIGMMRSYAVQDAGSPEIQADARRAVSESPTVPPEEAVFWFVKRRLQFVRDEDTALPFQALTPHPIVETLIRPRDMSTLCPPGSFCQRIGDCDDYAMYAASLLRALGIPSAFVTVAAVPGQEDFSHVYIAAYPPGRGRVPLDTSHGDRPGWETQSSHRVQEWPLDGGMTPLVLILALGAIGALML